MSLTLIIIIATVVLVILIIAGLAVVNFSYEEMLSKYNQIATNPAPVSPMQFAQKISDEHFGGRIKIEAKKGMFVDSYASNNVLTLSQEYANKKQIAGLAICAHELGHAFQFKDQKARMKKYGTRLKISKVLSKFVSPLLIGAVVLACFDKLIFAMALAIFAILCFLIALAVKISTISIEQQASDIAITILHQNAELTDTELKLVREFLLSAKQTYVADLLKSILKWTGFTRK